MRCPHDNRTVARWATLRPCSSTRRRSPPGARHLDAREGYEVVLLARQGTGGWQVEGTTTAVEAGEPWAVSYVIDLDARWRTRRAVVSGRAQGGHAERVVEANGRGHWTVDGRHRPDLDGCLDVDLESSAFTNAFPVHNMALVPGDAADAPAAYVRALDLTVERLEQRYVRLDPGRVPADPAHAAATPGERYHYTARAFDVRCELAYDASGLVLDYPGIAVRSA